MARRKNLTIDPITGKLVEKKEKTPITETGKKLRKELVKEKFVPPVGKVVEGIRTPKEIGESVVGGETQQDTIDKLTGGDRTSETFSKGGEPVDQFKDIAFVEEETGFSLGGRNVTKETFEAYRASLTGKEGFTRTPEVEALIEQRGQLEAELAKAKSLGLTQEQFQEKQAQLQALSGQIGQFEELGISPTGLDIKEGLITGAIDAIPRAIQFAAGAAVIGGVAAGAVGIAVGAVAGFTAGMVSSMVGSFKQQRRDTTTAQQRTLDEGKQTMKDWATLARNDPVNKAFYLGEYNKQSAQIDQAYRQMKLDTSKDVTKFETALPNLAEFESFYSSGGERDTLDEEMRIALLSQIPLEYDMMELANRRGE